VLKIRTVWCEISESRDKKVEDYSRLQGVIFLKFDERFHFSDEKNYFSFDR